MRAKIKTNPEIDAVIEKYAMAVTEDVLETINPADPADPIARQYIPDVAELVTTPDERDDPIGDEAHSPVKGIVHRYHDRVLLKPVHVCAVYCRFCFRREVVGPGSETLNPAEMTAAMEYIRATPHVWEVIVTGGDPFVLSPRRLKEIMDALNAIPHVQVIRFHTRVPIADPSRVTDEMIEALHSEKAVYIVLHANHPNELTDKVRAATQKFTRAGMPMLSQSTLLRGVNDKADVLEKLFRDLTVMKIKPYYIHHPDKAPGTSHFRLPLEEGRALIESLRGRLSGIAQPHYVLDIPGGFGKILLHKGRVIEEGDAFIVIDDKGNTHKYK